MIIELKNYIDLKMVSCCKIKTSAANYYHLKY